MNPQEALSVLNQLRLKVSLTGQEHDLVRQAIEALTTAVNTPKEK